MHNRPLGCLTPIGLAAALVTALLIAGYSLVQGGALFSPGGLSAKTVPAAQGGGALGGVGSHMELAGNCSACHTAPWDSVKMADRCQVCHTQVQQDLQNVKTLHGGLVQKSGDANCLSCHTEHHGPEAFLTRLDLQNFPHEVTGFSLAAHKAQPDGSPFACKDCHGQNYTRGGAPACQDCHARLAGSFMRDHTSAFGPSCRSCHDGVDAYGKAFDHNKTSFALTGKHAQAGNTTGPEAGLFGLVSDRLGQAGGQTAGQTAGKTACQDCHHNQTTIAALRTTPTGCASCHQKDDASAHQGLMGADCQSCHTTAGWKPATFDHAKNTRFALLGKHAEAKCSACHTSPDLKATPQDCAACHQKDDAHQGALGAICQDCHTPAAWKPSTFDHAKAAFQLTGKHAQAACSTCHTDQKFKGIPQACAGCHSKNDPHKGALGADCAACHTTAGWKPTTFDHAQAAFPLTGRHLLAACASCHADQKFKGAPKACGNCHQKDDAHKGGLGTQCAQCHSTAGWKPSTFNHSGTAFPLSGAHTGVACATCHANAVFKGTPTTCVSCHQKDDAAAHQGAMGADCTLCHTTAAWKPSTFNHNNAAFQLSGAHAGATCASCHANGKFKGTPSTCVSCHQKDDAHQGSLGTNCAQCHSTSAWKPSTFNHNNAAFKLTGAHASVNCATCHTGGTFKGTPSACYACHAKDDHHGGQFGTQCASCHATDSWSHVTFNHANSGFPLTGAHAGVACAQCHANGYQGTPTACSSCHSEPAYHAGLFLANCASCHSTSAWVPAQYTAAHAFPKNHGGANTCRSCHPSTLSAYTCYTCHDKAKMVDKHKDKNVANLDNCIACHPTGRGD